MTVNLDQRETAGAAPAIPFPARDGLPAPSPERVSAAGALTKALEPAAPEQIAADFLSYVRDAGERAVLFWDTLR